MPKSFDKGSELTRVAIYTRFSSKMQRETSTEDQIRECREAAKRQGWIVLDEFIRSDEAKSGQSLFGRDGLDDLMKLAQQKDCPFDGIAFYDTSRLGRNLSDNLKTADKFKYSGIFLYFKTRELDSRDPSFRTLFIQYSSKDEDYCFDSAERTHRGQRGRVLQGFVASGRLYGYQNVTVPSDDGTKWRNGRAAVKGVKREIIPGEAAVVTRIFEMYTSGLGCMTIALKLNEEGVPAPGIRLGRPQSLWSAHEISEILRNEKYVGIYVWNQSKVVRNPNTQRKERHKHPESEWERVEVPEWRIVTEELWEAAARERVGRRGKAGRKLGGLNRTEESRRNIFSGQLHCEKCGRRFIAFRTLRGCLRYACLGWKSGACSNNVSILLSLVESNLIPAISQCVREGSLRDKLVSSYRDQMVAQWNERVNSAQKIMESEDELRKKHLDLNRKAENIVDALQDDGRNPFLTQRLKTIKEELAKIDLAMEMAAEIVTPPLSEDQTRELITRKLAEIDAILSEPPEIVKHKLARHIDELRMKLVETPEGPRYEVTGDIRLFEVGDLDDVLLGGSFQRSCKQYTPLSFPLKASLVVRAEKGKLSAATRKKIGDAKRTWWVEKKKAKAAVA